jgi:hypothetical protein
MKPSKTCDNKQLNLFSSTEISSWKAVVFPIFISKKMRQRKIEQMEKFKSLIQAVKPMIELSVESQLAEIDKRIPEAHLVRFIQAAVFKIDTSQIEAKYSLGHTGSSLVLRRLNSRGRASSHGAKKREPCREILPFPGRIFFRNSVNTLI